MVHIFIANSLLIILFSLEWRAALSEADQMRYSEIHMHENECPPRSIIVSAAGGMGLCNQLDLFVFGLVLASISNRTLCVHGFKTEYSRSHEVPVEEILNINATNENLAQLPEEMGFKPTSVLKGIVRQDARHPHVQSVCLRSTGPLTPVGPKKCKFDSQRTIDIPFAPADQDGENTGRNDLVTFLLSDDIHQISRVSLSPGVPTQFDFFRHEKHIDHATISALYKCFVFAPFLIKAADTLMAKHNLVAQQYTAVHMRLEDDFVRSIYNIQDVDSDRITLHKFHYVLGNDFLHHLLQHITVDSRIYLVTGLTLRPNELNFFPYMMETLFNSSSYHFQDKLYMHIPHRRELHAIVDSIVAMRAGAFVGVDDTASTFSKYIAWGLPSNTNVSLIPVNYTKRATDSRPYYTSAALKYVQSRLKDQAYFARLRLDALEGKQTLTSTDLFQANESDYSQRCC
jgi:hypothetical protein